MPKKRDTNEVEAAVETAVDEESKLDIAKLAQNISNARTKKGWDVKKLSDASGVPSATITLYESGNLAIVDDAVMKKLQNVLGKLLSEKKRASKPRKINTKRENKKAARAERESNSVNFRKGGFNSFGN